MLWRRPQPTNGRRNISKRHRPQLSDWRLPQSPFRWFLFQFFFWKTDGCRLCPQNDWSRQIRRRHKSPLATRCPPLQATTQTLPPLSGISRIETFFSFDRFEEANLKFASSIRTEHPYFNIHHNKSIRLSYTKIQWNYNSITLQIV